MQRSTSWDDWRVVLAVIRAGGLSGAARSLGIHASTVARRIEQLERDLGGKLFIRLARGYALTPLGEEIRTHAERLEADVFELERHVAGADGALRGTLRFTTVLELVPVVSPALATFRRLHPGIELHLDTQARVLAFERYETDVALRPGLPPTDPDVLARPLRAMSVWAAASRSYLRGRPAPTFETLHEHDAVVFRSPSPGRPSPLDTCRTALVVDSKLAQAHAVRAGLGIGDLPSFLLDDSIEPLFELAAGDLKLWLLHHVDLRRHARVRAFVKDLTEAFSDDAKLPS